MFKPGEKVKFLNEVGEGLVVRMIDPETVLVRTPDDWEIPMARSNLIRMERGNYNLGAEKERTPAVSRMAPNPPAPVAPPPVAGPVPSPASRRKVPDEPEPSLIFKPPVDSNPAIDVPVIYLAMVPVDPANPTESDLKLYIVNDSSYFMLFNFGLDFEGRFSSRYAGQLEPDTKFHIETYQRHDLQGIRAFLVQALFFRTMNYVPLPPFEKKIRINPAGLFREGSFVANDFFDERSALFSLQAPAPPPAAPLIPDQEAARELAQKMSEPNRTKPEVAPRPEKPDLLEVDLHIHELVDEPERIDPAAILDIQMNQVRQSLNEAIAKKIRKVVFIHGVGQGRLKFEIRKKLDSLYKGLEYQDASFQEYGYGATMVLIPQNFSLTK